MKRTLRSLLLLVALGLAGGVRVQEKYDPAEAERYIQASETASAEGVELWTRKAGRRGRLTWIDTWARHDGRWQFEAAEDISVPIKP